MCGRPCVEPTEVVGGLDPETLRLGFIETDVGTKSQRRGRSEQGEKVGDPGRPRPDNRQRASKTRGSGKGPVGAQTEVGSQELGVGTEAVVRIGVNTELKMRGRDQQAEKDGSPAEAADSPSPPHFWKEWKRRDARVSSQMWAPGSTGRSPLLTLAHPGIRVWGPRHDRARSQPVPRGLGFRA